MPKPSKQGELVEVRPQYKIRCTCGLWITLGELVAGGEPIVLHPLPQCAFFRENDLLTYVRTLRQYYQGN